MTVKVRPEEALRTLLVERWEQVSRKLELLAGEIPGGKFEWRPVAGVRTCGDVLRHVAFWNQYVADSLRGKEADDRLNELPLAGHRAKTSVLDALKRTSRDVAAALREDRASSDSKTAELVVPFVEHTAEHYGQLVVYARLLGIIPPASR